MKLADAKKVVFELMRDHGLFDQGWGFDFDGGRARFGFCRYDVKRISLSRYLVRLNLSERVKNTILHEIAHALVGKGEGHGYMWRTMAVKIGCSGQRCYGNEVVPVKRPWQIVCANCGPVDMFRFNRKKNMTHSICRGSISYRRAVKP